MGTYLHGLFDDAAARDSLLAWAGLEASEVTAITVVQERELERLADAVEAHLDLDKLFPHVDRASSEERQA